MRKPAFFPKPAKSGSEIVNLCLQFFWIDLSETSMQIFLFQIPRFFQLLFPLMWVDANDYSTLHACVQSDAAEVCRLLDGGMDFDQYQQWAQTRPCADHEETLQALADH